MAAPIEVNVSQLRVSSVLNRDVKQYGKKFLVDGHDDTCWNSDQGSPQWITVDFEREVIVRELHVQFQGGFAGGDCWVETRNDRDSPWIKLEHFYPEDKNSLQIFQINNSGKSFSNIKLVFNTSTDFFGRITIYNLEICGDVT